MIQTLSRRRFISISASAIAASVIPGSGAFANTAAVRWQGIAMGAKAELILNHPDPRKAEQALGRVQDEIRRLEKIFSLFDPSSALSKLNQTGTLNLPPFDLIRCLSEATDISRVTDGAFDVTIQPLWDLYARHFSNTPKDRHGPSAEDIASARRLVGYTAIRFDAEHVSFEIPGMKLSLNGIAQGYITDRVAELLNAEGFNNVLIDLGETRGLGQHEDGGDWQVGIKAPDGSGNLVRKLALRNKAIATSGGYGTRFTADGKYHHLFDPKSGESANIWQSISVIANAATRADALSTAFSSMAEQEVREIAAKTKVSVFAYNRAGEALINVGL